MKLETLPSGPSYGHLITYLHGEHHLVGQKFALVHWLARSLFGGDVLIHWGIVLIIQHITGYHI